MSGLGALCTRTLKVAFSQAVSTVVHAENYISAVRLHFIWLLDRAKTVHLEED